MRVLPPPPGHDEIDLDVLITASERARTQAAAAVARSRALERRVVQEQRRSLASRMASRVHARLAVVEGEVDRRPVVAVVRRDGTVAGDPALLERARLVVSMGDCFDGGRLPATVEGDPLAVVLTLTRACDRVRSVQMALVPPNASGPPG